MKEKFQIDLFCYRDWIYDTRDVTANSIMSFNFIIIEKLTELLLWLVLPIDIENPYRLSNCLYR